MINIDKLNSIISGYKKYFPEHWKDERYKWEAIKHFQDNWDIDAEDFADMLKQALAKTDNLLSSGHSYPRRMIKNFANADADAVREMFRRLYDESLDLSDRITAFKNMAEELREKYNDGTWTNHYQKINAISVYLWLMYPEKYYIYKYEIFKKCSEMVDNTYRPKGNGSVDNVIGGYKMYDEIRAVLQSDNEIRQMLDSMLTDSCYPDPQLVTLTMDVGFYAARFYGEDENLDNDWFPTEEEYTPNLSVEDWTTLLCNPKVFDHNSLDTIKAFYNIGGQATCSELAQKYGNTAMHYSGIVTGLAKRVYKATNCSLNDDKNENAKWWPILFVGKYADKMHTGVYIWKLRDELKMALEQKRELFDDAESNLYNDNNFNAPVIWKISHGTSQTGIPKHLRQVLEDKKVVVVHQGTVRLAMQNKPQGEVYMKEIKKGDYFFLCYAGEIVLLGQFTEDVPKLNYEMVHEWNDYDWYERPYRLIARSSMKEKYTGPKKIWTSNYNSTCVKVTDNELFEKLILQPYFGLTLADLNNTEYYESYTKQDFLSEVYITDSQYDNLAALLKHKKNIILQGAPGVGKTFTAKRLAWSIMGEKDDSRIEFIQFHQSYSYEDFIMGYRPTDNGNFELKEGVFYRFCEKARNDPDKDYFFIIDEINRGNLSKIFGELLMLIENEYRNKTVTLAYKDERFSVPDNLYIIGMMNTADRSLAMIDYALRRRFSFFEMCPGFDSEGFKGYSSDLDNMLFNELINQIKLLNNDIINDSSLGNGFCIGHSYFCNMSSEMCTEDRLRAIVEYDIIPMLSEYWFDNKDQFDKWSTKLRGIFHDS